jgi:hypothetical protein
MLGLLSTDYMWRQGWEWAYGTWVKVKESVIRKPASRILFSTLRALHSLLDKDFDFGMSPEKSSVPLPLAIRGVLSSADILQRLQ